jgi:hypothetical protein
MRIAGGRATDQELRQEARERKRKSRARRKLPRQFPSLPMPEPTSDTKPSLSVTDPPVTESADQRAAQSRHYLTEFTYACRSYLPKVTEEVDRQKAREIVAEMLGDQKAKAA